MVSLDDCPTDEIEPQYERDNVHRIVNEDEIINVVLEACDEQEEEIEEREDADEHNDIAKKRSYTSMEKFSSISNTLNILYNEEEDVDKHVIDELEKICSKYQKLSHSRQSRLTSFFSPSTHN